MLQPTQTAAPAVPIHQSPQIMSQGGLRVGGRKWVGNIRALGVCVSTNIRALRHSLFLAAAPSTESGPFVHIEYSHRTTLCSCVIQFQIKSQKRNVLRNLKMEVKL